MQTFPLPGFQQTIKHALPQIVADQLATVKTTTELIQTITPEHPYLPFLIPTFYQSETDPTTSPYITSELSILFPRFLNIAQDVTAALESKSIALRERAIVQWQKVIQKELKILQKQSQGELRNPFLFGNPLKSDCDRLFKGRQKFADDIVRLILDRNRPTLVLHAPRRFGKTSFLYNLPRLLPSDLISVYLDPQSHAVSTDDAAFCQGLVRAIYKDSGSQGVKLPTPPKRQDFLKTPYIALEDWLNEALVELGDRRLLLNLDEFEKIGTAIKEGKITKDLFDELRHLIQHYEQLCFLFSGVQTLDELGPNWSSYFISVVPIKMLYLEPEEAEDLLINPDPDFKLRYDTGIVEEVLRLTRGHPYLVQLLGWAMVNQANLNHVQIVTSELLEAAIQDALTNGEPYFTNIWTEFTGTTPTEVEIGQQFLLQLAKGENIQTEENNSIKRLLRFHLIERRDNHYDFEVPLIKMWVKKKAVDR